MTSLLISETYLTLAIKFENVDYYFLSFVLSPEEYFEIQESTPEKRGYRNLLPETSLVNKMLRNRNSKFSNDYFRRQRQAMFRSRVMARNQGKIMKKLKIMTSCRIQ